MNDVSQARLDSPYQKLAPGQYRVLVLKPGLSNAPLEAHLVIRLLQSIGHHLTSRDDVHDGAGFEAISYCWGDAISPHQLHMNNGSITITHSLYSALLAFRHADRARYLWADAVCINQSDMSERSSQVRLMGSIYATADRVLVWLGEAMQGGSEALAFLVLTAPIVAKGDRSRRELLAIVDDHLQTATCCKCCSASPANTQISLESGLVAVAKLLERPWFGRLWVVQEIALAKEILVHCGSHFVSWEVFTEVARVPGQFEVDHVQEEQDDMYTISRGTLRTIWAHCNYLNQLRSRHRSTYSEKDSFKPTALCKDLLMLSRLECQDPHDRIYGVGRVLGLDAFERLRADYSISVSELYRRVVELSITAPANRPGGRAVAMLALANTEHPAAAELARPSWVPHLQHLSDRSRSKHTFYQWAVADRQCYADAAEFRCKVLPDDPERLLVRGRRFGRVDSVLPHSACPSKQIHRRTPNKCPDREAGELIQWFVRCCRYLETNLESGYLSSRFSETSLQTARKIFGLPHELIKTTERRSLPLDLVSEWLALVPTAADDVGDVDELANNLSPYITGYPYDREQKLCILDTQYGSRAAWIPPCAMPNDEIWYFAGAPYPFIVRQRADDNAYELQGDALVIDLAESDMLDAEPLGWSSAMQQVRQADADLKTWKESSGRATLKRAGNNQHLRNLDQRKKDVLVDAISRLKAFYVKADQTHEWIELR